MFPMQPATQRQKASVIEVFDKTNKSRLLGHLKISSEIQGMFYEVSLMSTFLATAERLKFSVDFMQESRSEKLGPHSRKITTIEQKILTTDVNLEKLMKLESFYLPGEKDHEQRDRLTYRRRSPAMDSY
jgi:hypothetical protein